MSMKIIIEILTMAPGIVSDVRSAIAAYEAATTDKERLAAVVKGLEDVLSTIRANL